MDYLVNPTEILKTRSKEFALRRLDPKRVEAEKTKWQLINIAVPVILIILSGLVYQYIRRTLYAK
jgi:hypothetical protein